MAARDFVVGVLLTGCAFNPRGGGPADGDDGSAGDDGGPTHDGGDNADVASPDSNDVGSCPPGYAAFVSGTYRHVQSVATWESAHGDCANDADPAGAFYTHLVVFSDDAERQSVTERA